MHTDAHVSTAVQETGSSIFFFFFFFFSSFFFSGFISSHQVYRLMRFVDERQDDSLSFMSPGGSGGVFQIDCVR